MPSATSPPPLQRNHSYSPTATPGASGADLPTILPAPTTQSVQAALPPSHTFDFIPQIHALVSRLMLDAADKNALQAKELVNEVAVIKRQIALAKGVIQGLPDINRSVQEQEVEIHRVRGRVERLRELIAELGESCAADEEKSR